MNRYHLIIRCDKEHLVHPPRTIEWIFAHVRKLVRQGLVWTRTDINHDDLLIEVRLYNPRNATMQSELEFIQADIFERKT